MMVDSTLTANVRREIAKLQVFNKVHLCCKYYKYD